MNNNIYVKEEDGERIWKWNRCAPLFENSPVSRSNKYPMHIFSDCILFQNNELLGRTADCCFTRTYKYRIY